MRKCFRFGTNVLRLAVSVLLLLLAASCGNGESSESGEEGGAGGDNVETFGELRTKVDDKGCEVFFACGLNPSAYDWTNWLVDPPRTASSVDECKMDHRKSYEIADTIYDRPMCDEMLSRSLPVYRECVDEVTATPNEALCGLFGGEGILPKEYFIVRYPTCGQALDIFQEDRRQPKYQLESAYACYLNPPGLTSPARSSRQ